MMLFVKVLSLVVMLLRRECSLEVDVDGCPPHRPDMHGRHQEPTGANDPSQRTMHVRQDEVLRVPRVRTSSTRRQRRPKLFVAALSPT
jgi:hypothetical protein